MLNSSFHTKMHFYLGNELKSGFLDECFDYHSISQDASSVPSGQGFVLFEYVYRFIDLKRNVKKHMELWSLI